jgi:hypothetical protein
VTGPGEIASSKVSNQTLATVEIVISSSLHPVNIGQDNLGLDAIIQRLDVKRYEVRSTNFQPPSCITAPEELRNSAVHVQQLIAKPLYANGSDSLEISSSRQFWMLTVGWLVMNSSTLLTSFRDPATPPLKLPLDWDIGLLCNIVITCLRNLWSPKYQLPREGMGAYYFTGWRGFNGCRLPWVLCPTFIGISCLQNIIAQGWILWRRYTMNGYEPTSKFELMRHLMKAGR